MPLGEVREPGKDPGFDLRSFPVFDGLDPTEIADFTSPFEMSRYPEGTEIITRGEFGAKVFFLLEGELEVFLPRSEGNQLLAEFRPPAIFGEMELLTGQPRAASVQAVVDVKVASVSFEILHDQIRRGDTAALKVMYNVAKIIAGRLTAINDKVSEIRNGRVEVRSEELLAFQKKLFSDWTF
jgi:CRP-like cAMP-binding protein